MALLALAILGVFTCVAATFPPALSLVVILACGVVLLSVGSEVISEGDEEMTRWLLRWTLGSLGAHFVLGLSLSSINEVQTSLFPDASYYRDTALAILDHWTTGTPLPVLPHGKEGFPFLLAATYRLFGESWTCGIAVNAIMAAALVPIMTDATRRLFGSGPARYMPAIVVFMPGLMWFASVPVREAGVFFLIAVALNCGVRLAQRVTFWTVVTLSLSLAALVTFRFQVALLLCVGLLPATMLAARQRVRTLVAAAVPVAVLAIGLSVGVGRAALQSYTATDPLETAAFYRSSPSELYPLPAGERSTFEADANVASLKGALRYLPVGYVYALFSPFPWTVGSTAQAIGVIDGVLWILFLPTLLRGAWRGARLSGKKILLPVVPAILIATVVALAINNVATVIRGRTHVGLLLSPILAVGIWQRRAEGVLEQ